MRRRTQSRKKIVILLCIFSILMTSDCTQKNQEEYISPVEEPTFGGSFRLAQLPPQTLDPVDIDDVYESSIMNQLFDGLLKFDVNLRAVPALAREWNISQDRLTYTFRLREDATFHHGKKLTAEDCIYSLTRILDPSTPSLSIASEYLETIWGAKDYISGKTTTIDGLKALDDHTLEIVLEKPCVDFLIILAMDNTKIVPQDELEKKGRQWFSEHPVGTGPFTFASWEKNHRIILEAYDQYFGGRPFLDTLIYEVPLCYDDEKHVEKFLHGFLETVAVPVGKGDEFRKGNFTLVKRPELGTEFIGFNVQYPPCNNIHLRQAICSALNRERLTALDRESFLLSSGILPPGMPGCSPNRRICSYDPEHAKRLLKKAGFSTENKLGSLEYWGVGIDTLDEYENDEMVKEDLARVGVDLDVKYESWLEFDQRIIDGRAQLFSMSLIADMPSPVSFLYSTFHSKSKTNYFRYHNTKVDSILDKAKDELNYFERLRMCQEIERIVLEDAPMIPLDHIVNIFAFQPYVKGVEFSPYGMADIPMEKIWLMKDK